MPNSLDLIIGGAPAAPTTSPQDQASHAASPTHFSFSADAKTVTLALVGFFIAIYGLHVAGRVVRA